MKKILIKFYSIVLLSLVVISCGEYESGKLYENDALLHFSERIASQAKIGVGDGNKDITIKYGTAKAVTSPSTVSLVFDAANSTAALGSDFQIIKGTDELAAGESTGTFVIRVLEAGMDPAAVVAAFKLSSSTVANATFDQTYKVTMSLSCPLSFFLGTTGAFDYTGWWNDPGQYLVVAGTAPNTLRVVDWLDIGVDLIVKYDDAGVVTFDEQSTGVDYDAAGNKYTVKQSTTVASTYSPCTRKLTLGAFWFVPTVGNFGEKTESFTGN